MRRCRKLLRADDTSRLCTQRYDHEGGCICTALRPGLQHLPFHMQELPIDERGYPVPWFVAWVDGKPEFRAMDPEKLVLAVKRKLCWVCGDRLGINVTFTSGPMCGISRTSGEPPSHVDCARWSAVNCPFLANPRMVRREDEVINNTTLREHSAGIALTRNPGVAMLWNTRQFELFTDGQGKPLFQMGEPETVEWYAEGKPATREQVMFSVASGMPNLVALAEQQRGGVEALADFIQRFLKFVPPESPL